MSYFKKAEFACKDGCGLNNINESFIAKLENARRYAGVAFYINSGCRCEKHNADSGGKEDSAHLKGLAADIRTDSSYFRFKILEALLETGFTRIGVGKNFIHVDVDETKPQEVAWMY